MLGRAGALYGLGRFEEATQEYRQAAWADGNPDPGKALNNLGLSFMSLGRPEDAVEAFKAAIGVEGYVTKGKADRQPRARVHDDGLLRGGGPGVRDGP